MSSPRALICEKLVSDKMWGMYLIGFVCVDRIALTHIERR